MKWHKAGRVYAPTGERWWAKHYATIPTAEVIDDQVIRVYFAALDENRFGRIGYVDLDADNPLRILYETPEPILDIGELGAFDDSGVNPSCVLPVGAKKLLYYIGWQRCERVPYMLFSGLAISEAGSPFTRHAPVPVLDRTPEEPFSRSAPFVMQDGPTYKLWYWSCEHWSNENGFVHYNNVIRYTESTDGVHWQAPGQVCISPDRENDYSVGRPWVIRDGALYRMWYSIRSKGPVRYRIGYAESTDGVAWQRKDDEAGIECSPEGWDSQMICYPCVVDVKGKRYMFYNGNRHGESGFGYAVLEDG